jgi:excisionase family DNA binding protein
MRSSSSRRSSSAVTSRDATASPRSPAPSAPTSSIFHVRLPTLTPDQASHRSARSRWLRLGRITVGWSRVMRSTIVAAGTSARSRRLEPVRAPREDRAGIAELWAALHALQATRDPHYDLVGPAGERHRIPGSVVDVLTRITEVLARGDAITVVPVGAVMTTQQAADILNVSRQYLVRLLDEGKLPFDRTGKHRRLKIEDVLAYKQQRDRARDEKLDELTRLTEELGGYDEPVSRGIPDATADKHATKEERRAAPRKPRAPRRRPGRPPTSKR